jgi:hypothetical protein
MAGLVTGKVALVTEVSLEVGRASALAFVTGHAMAVDGGMTAL